MRSQSPEQDLARRIETELEALANIVVLSPIESGLSREWRNYPGFWQKAKEISELFRSPDLGFEDRKRLWERHQGLCENVYRLRMRELKARQGASAANRAQVMVILEAVRKSLSTSAKDRDFGEIRSTLNSALTVMKEGFWLRRDRNEIWAAWKEADQELIRLRREATSAAERRRRTQADPVLLNAVDLLNKVHEQKAREHEKLLEEIEALEENIRKSWKLEWAARAKTWLAEKRSKEEELNRDLHELDNQIQLLRDRSNN